MKRILIIATILFSMPALGVNGWSGAYKVKLIDTLDVNMTNKSYITLDGFTDPACNNNRILLTSSDADHYKEMMSVILSAFHANSKINIYLNNSCDGVRVQLSK